MIIDVHSHYWSDRHFCEPWLGDFARVTRDSNATHHVGLEDYLTGTAGADVSIVFGLQARAAGAFVPNDDVAEFARRLGSVRPTIAFMSVDPNDGEAAVQEVERCAQDLGMKGLKLGLTYANLSPLDPRSMRVFERANAFHLPVVIHQSSVFSSAGTLVTASPILLDQVATTFPELPIIIAHVGDPWVEETITVMRRHRNMFADISCLYRRPSIALRALAAAKDYGVFEKLLFGTDYPVTTVPTTLVEIEAIAARARDFFCPALTHTDVEALFQRPSLELLGLDMPSLLS